MRLAITLLAILLGLLVAVGAFYNASAPSSTATRSADVSGSVQVESGDTSPGSVAPPVERREDAVAPAAPAASHTMPASVPESVASLGVLKVLPAESPAEVMLGSVDPESGFRMRLNLSRYGAGVTRIELAEHYADTTKAQPYIVHNTLTAPTHGRGELSVYPFAARAITINGSTLSLETAAWSLANREQTAGGESAEYRVTIADEAGNPVVDVVRQYTLAKRSFDFGLEQRIENRSGVPVRVTWEQYLQGDLPLDDAAYLGDRRMFVTGYFNPKYDPTRNNIYTTDAFVPRLTLVDNPAIWPSPRIEEPTAELAWLASENRYFSVVAHAAVPEKLPSGAAPTTADVPPLQAGFPRIGTVVFPSMAEARSEAERALVFTATSAPTSLAPGESLRLPMGVFAGPRESEAFSESPYPLLSLGQLVRYELSCAFCTFQPLARGLLWLLELFHAIVKDWGIAIILLVLLVRLILHPITKRAQVNMMKMGKQMQAIQPEVEKLRKKYKDDQPKLNQEMMKLYREKHINPANMLGCLPLLLQTPIWIALYAMLYFAIELRHQPAFYGVFQALTGGGWEFLADLSSPDYFWRFPGEGVYLDRIPGTTTDFIPFVDLHFSAINILPLLMGVVFYFNMKLTAPPPSTTPESEMTEQQRMMQQQQKIMRWVFPFMMPIFLYSAPSGLTLYICASTFAGIVDSYLVRKHVREAEASGKLFEVKPVKPGSLKDRVQKYMEKKQAELMTRQADLQQKQQRNRGPQDKRR